MEIQVYIHAQWSKYTKDFTYAVYGSDMTNYGYALVEERTLTFESPTEKQLRVLAHRAMMQQANKDLADSVVLFNERKVDADELLAIEDKSDSISVLEPDHEKIEDCI